MKSAAEPNPVASNDWVLSNRAKASRTDGSSSTMQTRRASFNMLAEDCACRERLDIALWSHASGHRGSGSSALDGMQKTHEIGNRPDLHFCHHATAMNFDGLFRRPQFTGDLLVQAAGGDKRQDLALTRR
jgi:hypothetical protein